MARLPLGRLGRRPSAGRVVVLLRAEPNVVAPLVPGPAPVVHGRLFLVAAFTRGGGFLKRDRLAWLSAGRELALPDAGAQRCAHTADRFSVGLSVLRADELELQLVAEACAHPEGSLFASLREAAAYLDAFAATRVEHGRAWEPLVPSALAWRVPGLPDAAQAALEFDSAFRQVPVRLLPAPRAHLAGALRRDEVPPLPASP